MVDRKELLKIGKAYANATDVPVFIIDESGKTIEFCSKTSSVCGFCKMIDEECNRGEECRRAHLYGSYQAQRFGEAYIYFCPYGLVHWAAPVVDDFHIAYSIIAGPVLLSTPENTLIEEVLVKQGLTERDIKCLYDQVHDVMIVPPDVANDKATLLFAAASYLSGETKDSLQERQSYFDHQASFSAVLQTLKENGDPKSAYPFGKEKDLISKIRLGDKAGAQELLNEIFGYIFFSQGNNIQLLKTRVTELVVVLSRAALEGGADNEVIFGLNYHFLNEINHLQTVDEIAHWLSKVMARFTDCVFNLTNVKNADIIYKTVTYLRENYMKDVGLEQIAKVVNLSPSYFSKIFNEEMKCNFSTYLNTLRVENSKKYLLDDAIPLVEVAGLVGYQDQSYFTKVFKKHLNISPGEFRKSRGFHQSLQ